MDGTVLVADDDKAIRRVLSQALSRSGCKVHATSMLTTLVRWVKEGKGDLVISDVVMPDGDGIEKLRELREIRPRLPVIVISARNTVMTAIQAEGSDAFAYFPKPFNLTDLLGRVGEGLKLKERAPASSAGPPVSDELPLIGRSKPMQSVYQLLAKIMNSDDPVQLFGETGTGKSLIARLIHDCSDRRKMPFAIVDNDLLADADSVADLFNNACGGTILIEELRDLSAFAQERLLRAFDALPEGAAKVVSTTQFDRNDLVENGLVRNDLFFRLSGVSLAVPPLRDRLDDLPLLARYFLELIARGGSAPRSISERALEAMRAYAWPGNVRQLENVMRGLIVTSTNDEISDSDVRQALSTQPIAPVFVGPASNRIFGDLIESRLQAHFNSLGGALPAPGLRLRVLSEIEGPLIRTALEASDGNRVKCAELLGVNRNTLRKKMVEHGILANWRKNFHRNSD